MGSIGKIVAREWLIVLGFACAILVSSLLWWWSFPLKPDFMFRPFIVYEPIGLEVFAYHFLWAVGIGAACYVVVCVIRSVRWAIRQLRS